MDEVKESDKAYLDNLLDEVLAEFNKPLEVKTENVTSNLKHTCEDNAWTEEVISEATKNFESTMRKLMENQQIPEQGAAGETKIKEVMSEFIKLAEESAKATVENKNEEIDSNFISTMKELNQNSKELQESPTPEDVANMFSNLGMDKIGEGDTAGLFSIMQNMMENILSKDVIYPPVKEIVEKFPDWLADNKSKLSNDDYIKHNKQYVLLKKVVETFEDEQESDTEEKKQKNFDEVLEIMQQLQNIGQPPAELCAGPGSTDLSSIFNSMEISSDQSQGQEINAEACRLS